VGDTLPKAFEEWYFKGGEGHILSEIPPMKNLG
jgi:hypothetical protein